jgi:hypothetical protein
MLVDKALANFAKRETVKDKESNMLRMQVARAESSSWGAMLSIAHEKGVHGAVSCIAALLTYLIGWT